MKRNFTIALTLVLFGLRSFSSTVTGTVYQVTQSAYARAQVLFTPLSTPLINKGGFFPSFARGVPSDANGAFTIRLAPGYFHVSISGVPPRDPVIAQDVVTIGVPDNDLTYNFTDLITNSISLGTNEPAKVTEDELISSTNLLYALLWPFIVDLDASTNGLNTRVTALETGATGQTPWTGDINGAGHALTNAGPITANGFTNSGQIMRTPELDVQNIVPYGTSMSIYAGSSSGNLYDTGFARSVDWKNRVLYDALGEAVLDYSTTNWTGCGPLTVPKVTLPAGDVQTQINAKQSGSILLSNFLAMGITNIVTVTGSAEGIGTNNGTLWITNVAYVTAATLNTASNILVAAPNYQHGSFGASNFWNVFGWPMQGNATPWSAAGTVGTNNNIVGVMFNSGPGGLFTNLSFNVNVGGNSDIGIFESVSISNSYPGTLLMHSGSNAWSTGAQSISQAFTLKPNRIYWSTCANFDSTFKLMVPGSITGFAGPLAGNFSLAALSAASSPSSFEFINVQTNTLPAAMPQNCQITGQGTAGKMVILAAQGL